MDKSVKLSICPAGQQAVLCFAVSFVTFSTSFFSSCLMGHTDALGSLAYIGPAFYFCLLNFVIKFFYEGFMHDVCLRAAFLGTVFALGVRLATFDTGVRVFGLYSMVLSFFHFSEFVAVSMTNPKTLSIDCFILNHSIQYAVAAISSWIEWAVEFHFFPNMKTYFWLSSIGVIICICGEILRKFAMFTAKTNFNHTVQFVKRPDHKLVTTGVYSYCRHPSYVGWFYWSIGTQIILLNPLCLIIYTLASWTFFNERIYAEELTLLTFFGQKYADYQRKVGTGLPFIKGNVPDNTKQKLNDEHWSY